MTKREGRTGFNEPLPTVDDYLEHNLARLQADQSLVERRINGMANTDVLRGESGMAVGVETAKSDIVSARNYRRTLKPTKKESILAEIVVYRLLEEYGLLGPEVKVIKTIEVDDFGDEDQRKRREGGTDLIVELEVGTGRDRQILRLAIDVTTADPGASSVPIEAARTLDDKIDKIRKHAGAGKDSARVKYCSSKIRGNESFLGPVYATKTLVMLPLEVVQELAQLDARAQLGDDEEAAEEIRNHPALAEIALQIDLALKLAQERAQRISRSTLYSMAADRQLADIIVRRTSVFRELANKIMLNGPDEVEDEGVLRMVAVTEQMELMYEDKLPANVKKILRTRN